MSRQILCVVLFATALPSVYANDASDASNRNQTAEFSPNLGLNPIDTNDDETGTRLSDPGLGLGLEGLVGLALMDVHDGYSQRLALGGSLVWQMGRSLFPPQYEYWRKSLHWEAGYLYMDSSNGTKMVEVATRYHNFHTSLLLGLPLGKLLLYGKAGPALTLVLASYQVSDSIYQGSPHNTTEYRDFQWGIVYAVGARGVFYLSDHLGLAGRLEISQVRHSYFYDTYFNFGIGMAF